jgi:hypothetical protein
MEPRREEGTAEGGFFTSVACLAEVSIQRGAGDRERVHRGARWPSCQSLQLPRFRRRKEQKP